jgi:hypothetical protein
MAITSSCSTQKGYWPLSLSLKRLKAGMSYEIEVRTNHHPVLLSRSPNVAHDQWMWKNASYKAMEAGQLDCPGRRSETQIEASEEAKTR